MEDKNIFGGIVGTVLSAIGTATQPNETLETISLIITIIGGIITFILIPILTWYKNSKKDGKIDKEEIKEGIDIATNGIKEVIDSSKKDKEK